MVHLQFINKKIIIIQALISLLILHAHGIKINYFSYIMNLLFSGLQTTVVESHKRVLLKLPVFTLFYACIYETNSVYVHKCVSIHVGMYVYTHDTC